MRAPLYATFIGGRRAPLAPFLSPLAAYDIRTTNGLPTWFQLGDQDIATHIRTTDLLRSGARLTGVMRELAGPLGVRAALLPMCDEPVATLVRTADGVLDFQEYFVRRGHQDPMGGLEFAGVEAARVTPEARAAVAEAELIVFCPSNPLVSIGPILAVPGMRDLLRGVVTPIVAVSPIVGGKALRGPAAAMLDAFGHEHSALGVARLYEGLAHGFVLDEEDRALAPAVEALGMRALVAPTVMSSFEDRRRLAAATLAFARIAMTVWAVVPVKTPHAAKTRLASVLSPRERATLARRLLADTLACHALAGTIVVGGDRALRAAATQSGAWACPEPLGGGRDPLNAAVAHGCRRATERDATAALILPADLPLLTPDVIARFLREAGGASVAIAPDAAGAGTIALLLRPPPSSPPPSARTRARHQERAGARPGDRGRVPARDLTRPRYPERPRAPWLLLRDLPDLPDRAGRGRACLTV